MHRFLKRMRARRWHVGCLKTGDVRCDNNGLAAPGLSIQMKLARLIKVRGLLVRSRPRRTPALLALSASAQTIDLAGVNLQLKAAI